MNEIFERFPRLGERQHQLAGLLSGGEQQLLALNRALLSRRAC
jgi:branched-chain amino acid transport system ATP-binding protein